jgi:hypothetical protein
VWIVAIAGVLQFTAWKARHLAAAGRNPGAARMAADAGTAWRHGLRLGLHCITACAGPTAILLVLGSWISAPWRSWVLAITAERLAPAGVGVARVVGAAAGVAGCS